MKTILYGPYTIQNILQMKVFNSILTIMTGHVSYEVSYVVESQYDWVRPILLERMATHPRTDSFTPVGQEPLRLAGRLRTRSRILSRKIGLAQSY